MSRREWLIRDLGRVQDILCLVALAITHWHIQRRNWAPLHDMRNEKSKWGEEWTWTYLRGRAGGATRRTYAGPDGGNWKLERDMIARQSATMDGCGGGCEELRAMFQACTEGGYSPYRIEFHRNVQKDVVIAGASAGLVHHRDTGCLEVRRKNQAIYSL